MSAEATIRFYFSLRSPYAWLAAERLRSELAELDTPIEWIPIFPTAELFPNDPSAIPEKIAYLVQDIRRLARAQGLSVTFPSVPDCDWSLSHAAALGALREGAGPALTVELFRRRFQEGLDLGEDAVIAKAAREAGLEPTHVLELAHSSALRDEVASSWGKGVAQDGIFGVPSFVYAGKLYWGQDRMHFLRSAVIRKTALAR